MLSTESIGEYLAGNHEDEYQMQPLPLANHRLSLRHRENKDLEKETTERSVEENYKVFTR